MPRDIPDRLANLIKKNVKHTDTAPDRSDYDQPQKQAGREQVSRYKRFVQRLACYLSNLVSEIVRSGVSTKECFSYTSFVPAVCIHSMLSPRRAITRGDNAHTRTHIQTTH